MPRLTIAPLLVVLAVGCDSNSEAKPEGSAPAASKAAGSAAGSKAAAKPAPEPEASLPTETETLALDEGDSAIPATVVVPKGCTTFNDSPTQIRISYDKGELFGIQVHEGNEFNTNLDETEKMMAKSEYSNNEILEKTDTLLRWTMQSEGSEPAHNFNLLVKLGDKTWVCKQGNYGGWTAEEADRQIEACKTLAAKG